MKHGAGEIRRGVVTILGLGYSGSHYLSLLLGSHSKTVHIGEALFLARPHRLATDIVVCAACGGGERCPLLQGIGPHNIDDLYRIIFSRVDPSVRFLIDTSKRLSWASRFTRHHEYAMKYLHLIRDPMALIRRWGLDRMTRKQLFHIRWKVMRALPRLAGMLALSPMSDVYLYYWLIQNKDTTQFIKKNNLDAAVVTYRDLARDPAGELTRLMSWLGLAYEPTQLEYWNITHHGTQKSGYEWIKKEKKQDYIDLRWQTELPQEMIRRVVDNPMVNAYLTELGLAFVPDGLTRLRPIVPLVPLPGRSPNNVPAAPPSSAPT
jgi:hypothetical protein